METLVLKYSTVKREKSTSVKGHYVRNADLLPAIIEAKEEGKLTNKLIIMIQLIAERYSRKSNFIGYSFREDMVSAAVENLVKNWHKFNQEKYSNPFAFYTTAIHNSFLQFMADEKKHRNIRDALLIDAGSNPSFNFMQGEQDETHFEVKESDEHYVPEKKIEDIDQGPISKYDLVPVVKTVTPKEVKVRHEARIPSAVVRYGPADIIIDPDTGAITMREKPVLPAVKVSRKAPITKKAVKEKVLPVKKKAPAQKPVKNKNSVLLETKIKPKTRVKKTTEKPPTQKPAAKVAAKKAIKKVK